MPRNVVVLGGSEGFDLPLLNRVAEEFGWGVRVTADVLAAARQAPVAVLLKRGVSGTENSWADKIRSVGPWLPESHVVLCHGFSEPIDWPELSDLGAFHAMRLPLQEMEVRQSLGFIWQAENRKAVERARSVATLAAAS